jgi:hypothetical protein
MSNDLALLADLHPSLSDMPTAIQSMWDFKAFRDRGFDLLKSMYPDVEMEGEHQNLYIFSRYIIMGYLFHDFFFFLIYIMIEI